MKLKVSQSIEIRKILAVSSHQKNSDHTFAVHPASIRKVSHVTQKIWLFPQGNRPKLDGIQL